MDFLSLSPKEQEELTKYQTFKQDSFKLLNDYIKQQSGSAVSWQEAERLQLAMPNAGKGIFDGDDPVSFKAKLDNITQQLTVAQARAALLLKEGKVFDPKNPQYSLGQVKNRLIKDARKFQNEAKKRGLSDAQARDYAQERLRMEYGI